MNGKWSEYSYRENVKVTERYKNLIVYNYYDDHYGERRYAVVLEDTIMLNSREYPSNEIHRIADIYGGILHQKKSAALA